MRTKLQKLLEKLENEIARVEVINKVVKEDADSISRAAPASPSTSGDRYHAEQQALMGQEKLQRLINLKLEVEESIKKSIPNSIKPVSYVVLKDSKGNETEKYLADTSTNYSISTNSPIGQKILGKKVGERYEYEIEGIRQSGVIISIE